MLRLLHTADWHLGHAIHGIARDFEHARFLDWLADVIEEYEVDALLVCGDVFDTINPPASAQRMFYRFVAGLKHRRPTLEVVVVGGNHDSAARLEVAAPVLDALGVHVVGGITRDARGDLDLERLVVPLRDAKGDVAAWCAAVPFLRVADLRIEEDAAGDPLIEGVRAIYARVLDAARARCADGQALVATGHCYMVGGELSELSERRILGGNQHALPVDVFPADVAYAALGHLHKAQRVGGRENVRYCGSPLPLSMGEIDYAHQVVVVMLDGARCDEIRPVRAPRAVEFVRVPRHGAAPLGEVLEALAELPGHDDAVPAEQRPFLEVRVALERPEPDLRRHVEQALDGRAPRLVRLVAEGTGHGLALAEQSPPRQDLAELEPAAVFESCYARAHDGEPDDALRREFEDLLEAVREGDAP